MNLVGLGYRKPLAAWIDNKPLEIECLEITAEHFFDGGHEYLKDLARHYPTFVHGLGLSLGTPGPLERDTLDRFAQVVEAANPEWISEHIAFTRSEEVDLGHLNPIVPSKDSLAIVAGNAQEAASRCQKPIILENITSHLRLQGELPETEFLNQLCDRADCGLLLDVTNLFINSQNHGFDATAWLHDLDPKNIVQLHVVGYTQRDGRFEDLHSEKIQADLWDLIHEVLAYAPVKAVIVERDWNYPPPNEMANELQALKIALESHRSNHRDLASAQQ